MFMLGACVEQWKHDGPGKGCRPLSSCYVSICNCTCSSSLAGAGRPTLAATVVEGAQSPAGGDLETPLAEANRRGATDGCRGSHPG